jgi:hypothetical protein
MGRITWVSGSPKRTLNSNTRGPAGGQHQAEINDAPVVQRLRREAREKTVENFLSRWIAKGRRRPGARDRRRPCRRCLGPGRCRKPACGPGWAGAARRVFPSVRAMTLNSSPVSISSIRIRSPAVPWARSKHHGLHGRQNLGAVLGHHHALCRRPGRRPSPRGTCPSIRPIGRKDRASPAFTNTRKSAVGKPWARMNSLARILLPSSFAAAALGPNTRRPPRAGRRPGRPPGALPGR